MSAGLIEENEKSKGPNGLVILEAYYGAIENVVDPSCTIDDIVIVCYSPHMQAYGRVLDVKDPAAVSHRQFPDHSPKWAHFLHVTHRGRTAEPGLHLSSPRLL